MSLTLRQDWTARAKCANEGDVMFGDDVEGARAICQGCPVRRECLASALDGDIDYGVWAGLTFEERTKLCPICRSPKAPEALACSGTHTLERLARLVELQQQGDPTVSVSRRLPINAPHSPGCIVPRGRSHSTAKAYKLGCRCTAARLDLYRERLERGSNRMGQRLNAEPRAPRDVRERFMAFVKHDGDHWLWKGSTNGTGYGNFWVCGAVVRAHIWAYETFVEPLPPATRLRPRVSCPRPLCVNPACYEPVRR